MLKENKVRKRIISTGGAREMFSEIYKKAFPRSSTDTVPVGVR